MNPSSRELDSNISIAIIALVAVLALLGVVTVTIVSIPLQQAEAGCEKGPAVNQSFAKSNGKCFHP